MWVAIDFPRFKAEFLPSPDYVAWRRDNRVFQQIAASSNGVTPMVLSGPEPAEVTTKRVSSSFLATLQVAPALGRSFTRQEELPNGPKAVILSDRFWRAHFGARPGILGHAITLDGKPYTVVGVLPPSFVFPFEGKIDALTPMSLSPTASHHDRGFYFTAAIGAP